MLDANLESMENLRQNLEANEIDPDEIPIVIQYNKRDLPNALPLEIMNERLNPRGPAVLRGGGRQGHGRRGDAEGRHRAGLPLAGHQIRRPGRGRGHGHAGHALTPRAASARATPAAVGSGGRAPGRRAGPLPRRGRPRPPAPAARRRPPPRPPLRPPAPRPRPARCGRRRRHRSRAFAPRPPSPAAAARPRRPPSPRSQPAAAPARPGRARNAGRETIPPLPDTDDDYDEDLLESLHLSPVGDDELTMEPAQAQDEEETLDLDPEAALEMIDDETGPRRSAPGADTVASTPVEAEEIRRRIARPPVDRDLRPRGARGGRAEHRGDLAGAAAGARPRRRRSVPTSRRTWPKPIPAAGRGGLRLRPPAVRCRQRRRAAASRSAPAAPAKPPPRRRRPAAPRAVTRVTPVIPVAMTWPRSRRDRGGHPGGDRAERTAPPREVNLRAEPQPQAQVARRFALEAREPCSVDARPAMAAALRISS